MEPLGATGPGRPQPDRRRDRPRAAARLPSRRCRTARWGYLSAITGWIIACGAEETGGRDGRAATQAAPAENLIEALYHFCDGAAVVTLRVTVPMAMLASPASAA